MNARRQIFVSVLLLFLLCCPGLGHASPVPALKADQASNWDTAWELAWATAWEACGQLAAASAPSPMEDALMQSAVDVSLETPQSPFGLEPRHSGIDLAWGVDTNSSRAKDVSSKNLVTPGKLFVQIDPIDAEVELLNGTQPFAQGMVLESGEYVLAFKREGYATQTRRVEVIPGMAATVRVSLDQGADAQTAVNEKPADLPVADAAPKSKQSEVRVVSAWDSLFKQLSLSPRANSQREAKTRAAAASISVPQAMVKAQSAPQPVLETRDASAAFSQGALAAGQIATTGMLFVDAKPYGATVRVMNIRPKFKQGMELASGKHRVQVSLPGYKTVEREVQIASGQSSRLSLTLDKAPSGRLYVETEPAGATVRVKNIRPKFSQGMELSEGKYQLEITLPGGKPVLREVEVAANMENRVQVSVEGVSVGRLFVETDPANARVTLPGLQTAFFQGMELPQGRYSIVAASAEHKSKATEIEIVAGADNRVQLSLERAQAEKPIAEDIFVKKGRLYVQVDPQAQVKILRIKPKFSQGIELSAGRYTVSATRKGFMDAKKEVDIIGGRDTFIALNLVAKNGSQPSHAALPAPTKNEAARPVAEPVATQTAPAAQTAPQLGKDERAAFDVESFVSMAIVAVNAGDYASAMEASKQALKLDPNSADACKSMGDAYLLQEAYAEALSWYDRALSVNPNDTRLRQNKNFAAEQVQLKGKDLKPTYGQATIRESGMSYQLGKPTIP